MKEIKQFKQLILALLASICLISTAMAEETDGRLLPVDDSYRDASLQQFLDKLRQVVTFREPESLVPLLYSQMSNGKGIPEGAGEFARHWRMDALDTELWDELDAILSLGGSFLRSNRGVKYCAPYVFTHFPDELDIFGHGVVIDDDVALKSEANVSSRTLRKLSYHLLRVNDWRSVNDAADNSWIKVTVLDNGDEGYVRKEKIRSPSDYHVCFLQFENGWRIVSMSTTE